MAAHRNPLRGRRAVPGAAQQLWDQRGSSGPRRARGAYGGLSSSRELWSLQLTLPWGKGSAPLEAALAQARHLGHPRVRGLSWGYPNARWLGPDATEMGARAMGTSPCQACKVWGWVVLTLGTCVVGRAQAGVVGGTGHAGAPILAAVLLAGVTGSAAARAVEACWTQAPATGHRAASGGGKQHFRVIPSQMPAQGFGKEHTYMLGGSGERGSVPTANTRHRGGWQRTLMGAGGEDAELPRQQAERPLSTGKGGGGRLRSPSPHPQPAIYFQPLIGSQFSQFLERAEVFRVAGLCGGTAVTPGFHPAPSRSQPCCSSQIPAPNPTAVCIHIPAVAEGPHLPATLGPGVCRAGGHREAEAALSL